jgi:hypothetical protein
MWGKDSRPAWCWIECTKIDQTSPGKPTPAQVRSEVWMALIHGAKGFGYFCHIFTPTFIEAGPLADTTMKNALSVLNHQILALAPVLNSPTVTGVVTVQSSNASVPVDVMVKNHGGSTYVFAAAMRGDTTTGRFSVTGLSCSTSADVLDEGRSITVAGGAFSDRFEGYGVHLYKIPSPTAVLAAGASLQRATEQWRKAIGRAFDRTCVVIVPNEGTSVFDVRGVLCTTVSLRRSHRSNGRP